MTEREYVEGLRSAASDYLEKVIRSEGEGPPDVVGVALGRWTTARERMSPGTFVSLCDAWLAKEGADD